MLRKIDLMHKMFGYAENGMCKQCEHFNKYRYHDKNYQKCEVYGITNSEATDWVGKNEACGLFPNKEYNGDVDIVRLVRPGNKPDMQIAGQMTMFGGRDGPTES